MIRYHAEGVREGPILGAGGALQASPETLLEDFRAGKLRSLQFGAQVYVTGPNRNHFVIPDKELAAFAASFEGLPFLRDHEENLGAVGGRIVASELVDLEDGRKAIRQRIMATKPWAMENILDGTINRFSIGWFAKRQVCTVCNTEFLSQGCKHMPWDLGKTDEKSGAAIELRTEGVEGREVSAVVTPAVPGTGVEGLLRAKVEALKKETVLALTSGDASSSGETKEGENMDPKILAALSLAETAEAPEVLAKIEQLKAAPPVVPPALMVALGLRTDAGADEAIVRVVEMTAPGAFVAKADHDKVMKELTDIKATVRVAELKAQGKITPATEAWALKMALENPEAFEAFFANGPRVTALGTAAPTVLSKDPEPEMPQRGEIAIAMGVTEEEYAKEVADERKLRLATGGR